jgi:deoxyadenosine/deoxycytidine kinase
MINPFIGLAGNIGSGKTTFTKFISQSQKWTPFYEPVSDNPYLKDFYNDMPRWGFNLQIYFLHKRFEMHKKMSEIKVGVVQDRTIYEDKEIFAKNLFDMKKISKRDWENYSGLFSAMSSFLKKPDLVIYLKASTDILLKRIQSRNRDFERDIDPEYLRTLNTAYNKWIDKEKEYPVLVIDTDNFNIYKDQQSFKEIENKILKTLL